MTVWLKFQNAMQNYVSRGRHSVDLRPWFSPAFHARLCRCSVFAVVVPRMAGIQLSRCNPKKLSLIRKWGGVKVNPGSETFLKVLSLIPNFNPLFVNLVSEKTSETNLGDACSCHLNWGFRIKFAEEKSLHISGHLRGSKSTHRKKYF